jgi:hypothetical protein
MRTLLGTIVVSTCLATSGLVLACDDVADSHDDAFAQMTKPAPNATPIAKSAIDSKQAVVRTDKRVANAPARTAPVKVAARGASE